MQSKKPENFNICTWNANGIQKHKLELEAFLQETDTAIICVQESHLHTSDVFRIKGFHIERKDRAGAKRGGGVMIAVRQTICYARVDINLTDNESEVVGIIVKIGSHPVYIYSLYQAPNRSHLSENFEALLNVPKAVILAGDFNAKSRAWGSRITTTRGRELAKIITKTKATPHYPEDPTTMPGGMRRGDVIDFFITKRVLLSKPKTRHALSSDHFPVTANLAFYPSHLTREEKTYTNWQKYAYRMTSYREGPNNDARNKLTHLTETIQKHLQSATVCGDKTSTNPLGLNIKEKELIQKKNKAKTKWKRSGSFNDKNTYYQLMRNVKQMLRTHSARSWEKTLEDCSERDSLWPIVKRLRIRAAPNAPIEDENGVLHFEDAEKARITGEFLHKQFIKTNRKPLYQETLQ